MKLQIILLMSLFSFFGCGKAAVPTSQYPSDTFIAKDGTPFSLHFFGHASLAVEVGDNWIYIDPVSQFAQYAKLPKADLILITHLHDDHLDRTAVDMLSTAKTDILCDKTSAATFDMKCHTMMPGNMAQPRDYVKVEAVPAYNITEGRLQFHPKEREDVGYVLTIGGTRIYIAGDTEDTPEVRTMPNIDIAFLPVNQPYTMTVDQAVDAVKAFRPAIFYPYHYGQVDEKTDIDRLVRELQGVVEVRVQPME